MVSKSGSIFLFIYTILLIACDITASQTLNKKIINRPSKNDLEPHLSASRILKESNFFSRFLPLSDRNGKENRVSDAIKALPSNRPSNTSGLIPVLIVPSLIGNQIEASLSGDQPPNWYCWKNSDWYSVWINKYQFIPYEINCWKHNMELIYNSTDRTYNPPKGVKIRFPDYGEVKSAEYLDEEKTIGVWNDTIKMLYKAGYKDGYNLRVAPYEWRAGPDSYFSENDFLKMKQLIEETYEMNSKTPVAVTSLSMGGPRFILFLNQFVDQKWKDKYIHSYTSLSGVFGGSSFSIDPLLNGNIGYGNLNLYDQFQSWGSLTWLLPTTDIFGKKVFVTTATKNYTAFDYLSLFADAGFTPIPAQILSNVKPYRSFTAPGVRMNCIYGYDIPTVATWSYLNGLRAAPTNATLEDGDGTVLTPALDICKSWKEKQTQRLDVYEFEKMGHAEAVRYPAATKIFFETLGLPYPEEFLSQ